MIAILRILAAKIRGLFVQAGADREFDEELHAHLQLLTERLIRLGMSPDDAAKAARREFGNATLLQQRQREVRTFLSLTTFWRDVRFGARQLGRNPLFTSIAVFSLALGIGANTAIFTIAKKILLDTLPVKNPHELRMLTWVSGHEQPVPPVWGDVSSTPEGGLVSNAFSYPVFEELRKKTDFFQDLVAFKDIEMTASVDGHSELIACEMVSGSTFGAMGVGPILGRLLNPADDAGQGEGPVAVISEGYWAARFDRSGKVLGKSILLNGVPITIVGVSPVQFTGLQMGNAVQIFVPLTMQPLLVPREQLTESGSTSLLNNPQSWWVQIVARLRPDVSESRLQAVLDVVLRQTAMATLPKASGMDQLHLKLERGDRGLDSLHGEFAKPSYVLLALAGLVLVLACVNLANLLLARGASRQREMSMRLALGASKGQILRQVLTESLLLSSLGGLAGLVLGFLGRDAIPRLLETPWHGATIQADFDWQVLAFTVAVSLATGIIFGAFPAWQAMRVDVSTGLKNMSSTTAGHHRMWLGKVLVVIQIALSTVLLIGAGLFVRTLVNLNKTPLGFRADHILLFQLNPPRTRYTDAQMIALYQQVEERVAAIPGVKSISMSNIAIIGDGHSGSTFHRSGAPEQKEEVRVQSNNVGTDFFQTMGIPLLQGRGFTEGDTSTSPIVAVVNQTLARKFFPNENPIGQMFNADAEDANAPIQIIGIAADTRYADLRSETPPTFYLSYRQKSHVSHMVVEIRTATEPGSILSQVRRVVESLDRNLPLIDVRTMTEQVKASLSRERIFAQLTSGFGVLALVLASIGIYGIMAYTVVRRTSEIGVRMALGARTGQVLSMVLREASWMAVMGVAFGIGGTLWLTRFVSTMLYGLKAADPLTLAGAAGLLILVALLAGFGPARRASHIDPIHALRQE